MAKSTPICEKHEWLVLQAPDGRLVIMCDRCQHIAGTVPATGYVAPLRYVPSWPNPYVWPTVTWQAGGVGGAGSLTYDTKTTPAEPLRHDAQQGYVNSTVVGAAGIEVFHLGELA